MIIEMAAVSIIGGFLCLDRSCLQIMISRPVVIAPLTGFCLGDLMTGLIIGAFTELLWIDKPQIGIYIPPNDSLISVAIVSSLLLSGVPLAEHRHELSAFAFLTMIPLGHASGRIDAALVRGNERLSEIAVKAAADGDALTVGKQHLKAILRNFVANVLFLFVTLTAGILIIGYLFPMLPYFALEALRLMYALIPVVVIAVALNTVKLKNMTPFFCGFFLVVLILVELIRGH